MNHGEKMATLEMQFRKSQAPFLTNKEVNELRDWYLNLYEYFINMEHSIEAAYFWQKYERMSKNMRE